MVEFHKTQLEYEKKQSDLKINILEQIFKKMKGFYEKNIRVTIVRLSSFEAMRARAA